MREFAKRSICWFTATCVIIGNAYSVLPFLYRAISIVITGLLLAFTDWFPILCTYWYGLSYLLYLLSSRYRQLFTTTINMQEQYL